MTTSTSVPDKAVDAAAEAVTSPFPIASRGTKGYDPASVDEFLRRARAAFEAPTVVMVEDVALEGVVVEGVAIDAVVVDADVVDADVVDAELVEPEPVSAELGAVAARDAPSSSSQAEPPFNSDTVRLVSFALVRKGYSIGAVDAALGRIEDAFAGREREAMIAAVGTTGWVDSARATAQEVLDRLTRPKGKRFRRAGFLRFGYRIDEVDIVAEKLVGFFERGEPVTVEQVRAAAFRMQRRGYSEAQVDAMLDAVVEVMLAIR